MLRDEGLVRMLRGVERHPPPDVPLEAIFERMQRQRRRGWALGGFGAAAALLAGAILLTGEAEPPVHVQLQIVDVPAADLADVRPDSASPQEAGP
jgi:hypothetical protein